MVGKLARRSGFAVFTVLSHLEWKPEYLVQVGVGHHWGEIECLKEEWPDCEIVGFEAHPGIAKAQRDLYPGKLIQAAVSEHSGRQFLYVKSRHADGSSLNRPAGMKGYKTVEIPTFTLDELLAEDLLFGRTLLWLDCEGNELRVLRGAEQMLEGVEVVNLEMTSNPPSPQWCDMMETHRWLVDHGFLRQTAHSNRSFAGQVDAIYVRRELWQARYCTCPCSFMENAG